MIKFYSLIYFIAFAKSQKSLEELMYDQCEMVNSKNTNETNTSKEVCFVLCRQAMTETWRLTHDKFIKDCYFDDSSYGSWLAKAPPASVPSSSSFSTPVVDCVMELDLGSSLCDDQSLSRRLQEVNIVEDLTAKNCSDHCHDTYPVCRFATHYQTKDHRTVCHILELLDSDDHGGAYCSGSSIGSSSTGRKMSVNCYNKNPEVQIRNLKDADDSGINSPDEVVIDGQQQDVIDEAVDDNSTAPPISGEEIIFEEFDDSYKIAVASAAGVSVGAVLSVATVYFTRKCTRKNSDDILTLDEYDVELDDSEAIVHIDDDVQSLRINMRCGSSTPGTTSSFHTSSGGSGGKLNFSIPQSMYVKYGYSGFSGFTPSAARDSRTSDLFGNNCFLDLPTALECDDSSMTTVE